MQEPAPQTGVGFADEPSPRRTRQADRRTGPVAGPVERLDEPDIASLRRRLRDPALRAIYIPWEPASGPGIRYLCSGGLRRAVTCRATAGTLSRRLRRALRQTDPELVEATRGLRRELGFLGRLLASASGSRKLEALLTPHREDLLCGDLSCAREPGSSEPFLSLTLRLPVGEDDSPGSGALSQTALLCRGLPDPGLLEPEGGGAGLWLRLTSPELKPTPTESPFPVAAPHSRSTDVVLVSMPFADLEHPSIGLGLLQATLPASVDTEILYLTYAFAALVGPELYRWIGSGRPSSGALLGEWIFSAALRGENPTPDDPPAPHDLSLDDPASYVGEVLGDEEIRGLVPEAALPWLLRLRSTASDFVDRCADRVLASRPRVVGFTSVFQQHAASLALARRLSDRRPDLPLVFGGANCEGLMGRALLRRFPWVDAVVSGEGEEVFPELIERLLAGRPVEELPGVYTREKVSDAKEVPNAPAVRDMDALPIPRYDDHFRHWRASGLGPGCAPRLLFETARGCWWGEKHHCTFCGLNGSGMAFRSKSPERALAELETLLERHPGSSVAVVDNILDMRYLRTLVPELARRRLGVELFYEVKANLRKDQLRLLRDGGIRELQPGIESLSDQVLELMRKGVSGLQNLQLLKWAKELGLQVYWNFLWGFAGESPEEYARMERLVPWITHLQPPEAMGTHRLDRFSPNFFEGERLGYRDIVPYPAYRHVYGRPGEDRESLADLAYYFQYGYRDRREVGGYVAGLRERLEEWQDVHEDSDLLYFDRQGSLVIFDYRPLRPVAGEEITVLTGGERDLYLACDGVRSTVGLARAFSLEASEVEDTLAPLVERGLLARDGDRYLALALPTSEAAGERA